MYPCFQLRVVMVMSNLEVASKLNRAGYEERGDEALIVDGYIAEVPDI